MSSTKNIYTPKAIEEKWAKSWEESKIFKAEGVDSTKPKFHVLDMFPYPSGEGLHIGHAKVFTASDVFARFKRMQGFNVLHATGWDAFGLPAEQYALKHKVHPKDTTKKNTDTFRRQMKLMGLSYDWDREINTTNPKFYKWTQWIFLKLWEKGLVKEVYEPINWCPSCKTGLANEDLEGNLCERCGSVVEKKPLRQFSIEITKYAEKLLEGLEDLDWKENVKDLERNWIGKSEGAEIEFKIKPLQAFGQLPQRKQPYLTFPILPYNSSLIEVAKNNRNNTTTHEGMFWKILEKDALGYDFTRQKVIGNFIVDFFCNELQLVVEIDGGYHDGELERDEERQQYLESLGLKVLRFKNEEIDSVDIENLKKILDDRYAELLAKFPEKVASSGEAPRSGEGVSVTVFTTRPDTLFGCTYCVLAPEHKLVSELLESGQIENKEEVEKYIEEVKLKTEIERSAEGREKTGVELKGIKAVNPANNEEVPVFIADYVLASYGSGAIMAVPVHDERDFEFAKSLQIKMKRVINPNVITNYPAGNKNYHGEISEIEYKEGWQDVFMERLDNFSIIYTGTDGKMINSGKFDGMESEEAKRAITEFVGGKMVTKYKLRDWVFARQRYWGEPFPLVHIHDGVGNKNILPVDESDLPVILPDVEDYEPTGNGESPLANISEWVDIEGYVTENNTFKIVKKGELPPLNPPHKGDELQIVKAKRETNTMPQWAGSSWYWLRYMDPTNENRFVGTAEEKYWGAVDVYLGGLEHATRHLIYARFWNRFLYDIGELSQPEPFKRLEAVGLVLGEGGAKMSKRLGNVINPDDVAAQWGVDTLRTYILFMGPYHDSVAWNSKNLIGPRRFIERVWAMQDNLASDDKRLSLETEILLNQTIKKVTEDNEALRYNTGVSALMILFNALEKENINKEVYKTYLKLLAPYAPFLTEEIWQNLGEVESIHKSSWPSFDPRKIESSSVTIALQINGKVRETLTFSNNANEAEVLAEVKKTSSFSKWVGESEIKKVIFVPNKIINLIV